MKDPYGWSRAPSPRRDPRGIGYAIVAAGLAWFLIVWGLAELWAWWR